MAKTALTDKLAAAGATIGEYCGADTARTFGETRPEFQALRSGAAVYDLGWRSKILVTGKDRVRWLNGMVTNNIRDLQPGYGNYSFLLTPQGRIQADLYVYNRGEYHMLGSERWQTPNILERLQKYIIMDKVELEDASEQVTAIALQGPRSREILAASGLDAPDVAPMQVADFVWNAIGLSITRMAHEKFQTYELWVSSDNVASLWDALVHAGARPVGTDAVEMFRVAAGIPRFGLDITDKDLPQETSQNQALNFNKGCYIGQEIVERIRARGNVHRTFAGFTIQGDVRPESAAKIEFEGKEVGVASSVLSVPSGTSDRTLALGIVRREASNPGTVVSIGPAQAVVTPIPFPEACFNIES